MNHLEKFMAKYGRPPTEFDPDYLEMLNMSKYRILDHPDMMNAKCANCGSTKVDGRKYVDFGLEVEWYGVVFLCSLCLNEIASKVGLYDQFSSRVTSLEEKLQQYINLLSAQGDTLEMKVTTMLEEVKQYFDSIGRISDAYGERPDHLHISIPGPVTSESPVTTDERAVIENTDGTSESTTSSGSPDFSSLAKFLSSDS